MKSIRFLMKSFRFWLVLIPFFVIVVNTSVNDGYNILLAIFGPLVWLYDFFYSISRET
ncbi:Uncharacterised protein [Paenibacillus macerans]|uniref:Putative membrane protein n=1 Tax=Paenibacillus macerans TaxID=44252 RepID=A0A090YQH1_PAEMA|nr:putative membrane protein [Paenibacillus macerans]GBK62409.1 hypothetical protein PbDSM24746_24130 [Paenibacillus macerans]GBK68721.1 hypothetical protein PbJCM17693_24290 [Paenibacillus macerans]GIP11792.1 hypothetical protein J1TS5_39620 [Paenibacillus macerans]SUD25512.1 Uncharacterised protein [Paenibacillus macerans]